MRTSLPPEKTAIPCKLVVDRELEHEGNVCRFEVRLVEIGLFEKEGIAYSTIFAPSAPFKVLFLLLGKFVSDGKHVH